MLLNRRTARITTLKRSGPPCDECQKCSGACHDTIETESPQMIDTNRLTAIALVDELHALAEMCEGDMRALIEKAAVWIDEQQAGYRPTVPHETTGYALVRIDLPEQIAA